MTNIADDVSSISSFLNSLNIPCGTFDSPQLLHQVIRAISVFYAVDNGFEEKVTLPTVFFNFLTFKSKITLFVEKYISQKFN